MPTPESHVIKRGGGFPILIVHGNGVDHRSMLGIDAAFENVPGYERLYVDMPGFGGTPALKGQGGLPQYAQWLDEAVEQLIGTAPYAAIGASVGGLLVRDSAARRPEQCRGLALLAPVIDPVRSHRTLPPKTVLYCDDDLLRSLTATEAHAFTKMTVIQSRENWERYRRSVLPGIEACDPEAQQRLNAHYELPHPPEERLQGYQGSLMVITARQDAVVGFADQWQMVQHYPHATFVALDRAGHNVQIEQPGLVCDLIAHWLRQLHSQPTPDC